MNKLVGLFFKIFVFWSTRKGYEEIAGFSAFLTIFLTGVLNILALASFSIFFTDDGLVLFPNFLGTRSNVYIILLLWGLLLYVLFLRRKQVSIYKAKIKELADEEVKRISAETLVYIVGSIVIFFLMAIVMIKKIP